MDGGCVNLYTPLRCNKPCKVSFKVSLAAAALDLVAATSAERAGDQAEGQLSYRTLHHRLGLLLSSLFVVTAAIDVWNVGSLQSGMRNGG